MPVRVPMVSSGGLYTSVDDACRYIHFHLTHGASLIDPALLAEMYLIPAAPDRNQGYALGLTMARAGDVPVRGHGGGGFGFLSDIYWSPDAGIGVVVLTNSTSHPLPWKLASDIITGIVPACPQRRTPLPSRVEAPASLHEMAGDYTGRGGDLMSFAVDDGGGVLIHHGSRRRAQFIGPHEFWIEQSPRETYRFRDLDDAGRPAYQQRRTG